MISDILKDENLVKVMADYNAIGARVYNDQPMYNLLVKNSEDEVIIIKYGETKYVDLPLDYRYQQLDLADDMYYVIGKNEQEDSERFRYRRL